MVEVTSFRLWISQIVILLGLLAFFIWLGIRPKSPSYTITEFTVQNGSISYALEIENPNKDSGIYFDDINLTFQNYQYIIGSINITHFYQDKGETTPKIGIVEVVRDQRKQLEDQISSRKAQLQVFLVTRIQYRTWGIKSRHHKMQPNGQLPVGTDGKIPGKTKLRIGWKKWKTRSM